MGNKTTEFGAGFAVAKINFELEEERLIVKAVDAI
jgi:hypothetical protein